jgi:hypothetical protein
MVLAAKVLIASDFVLGWIELVATAKGFFGATDRRNVVPIPHRQCVVTLRCFDFFFPFRFLLSLVYGVTASPV